MDLSNSFAQATLVDDIYPALTSYSDSYNGEDRAKMVMKLKNSLYGMVQSPLYWYKHLKGFLRREVLNQAICIPEFSIEEA